MKLYRIYVDRKGKYKITVYDKSKNTEYMYQVTDNVGRGVMVYMDELLKNAKLIHEREDVKI